MTFAAAEFLLQTQLDRETLEVWIAEGWLIPTGAEAEAGADAEQMFNEADVARARLIRDLIEDLGVNPEGVGIVLSLIDQVHGLRSALGQIVSAPPKRS